VRSLELDTLRVAHRLARRLGLVFFNTLHLEQVLVDVALASAALLLLGKRRRAAARRGLDARTDALEQREGVLFSTTRPARGVHG